MSTSLTDLAGGVFDQSTRVESCPGCLGGHNVEWGSACLLIRLVFLYYRQQEELWLGVGRWPEEDHLD